MADLEGMVVGEYGKTVSITLKNENGIVQDVSSYTGTKTFATKPPQGYKTVSCALSFLTDGTDGKVTFSFAAGDLDQAGIWECTISLEKTGVLSRSKMFTMEVTEAIA